MRDMAVSLTQAPDGQIDVTLRPEELGRLRLSLTPTEAGISVVVHTERPETQDLLRRHIDQLGQEFRQMGYRDVSFDFSQSSQQRPAQPGPTPPTKAETPPTDPLWAPPRTPRTNSRRDGLDIRL